MNDIEFSRRALGVMAVICSTSVLYEALTINTRGFGINGVIANMLFMGLIMSFMFIFIGGILLALGAGKK